MSSTVIRVNGKAPAAATETAAPAPAPEKKIPMLPPPVWVDENPSLRQITDDIAHPLEARPGKGWWICFAFAFAALLNLGGMVGYLFAKGIGIWGLNNSVGWAFDITNFVFWVGIGHAGTLISAILLLFRQQWRTSINRSAEAMTIFAVMCAGLFPAIHMGRPWDAFFIFPYFPNQRGPLWVNFRSPLVWDVFAISTYLTISLVFWYLGMVPDLATLRDRATGGIKKFIFRLLSLGWNGSHRTWSRYEIVSLVLAGLATPLVLSVHSIVSMDFATSLLPGWHTTIFPPYFVAGAIYSGFGMVLTLLIITRSTMNLQRYITLRHLDKMAKVTMLTGMIVSYAYLTEFFSAWYGGNLYERYHFINRGLAASRVPAFGLGHVLSHHLRCRHSGGQLRAVLYLLPAVYPPLAHDRHVGDQGRGRPRSAQDGPQQRRPGGGGRPCLANSSSPHTLTRKRFSTACALRPKKISASMTSSLPIPSMGSTMPWVCGAAGCPG
jgi:Ni/Fe-hydrogenase subunit HybB-like protein